jgi:hypothetical protein
MHLTKLGNGKSSEYLGLGVLKNELNYLQAYMRLLNKPFMNIKFNFINLIRSTWLKFVNPLV